MTPQVSHTFHTTTEVLGESGHQESEGNGLPLCSPLSQGRRGAASSSWPPGPAYCYRRGGGTSDSFWKYNDPLPSQGSLGSPLALKALSSLAPSLSRLFRDLYLPQPTGPAPLLGPLGPLQSLLGFSLGLNQEPPVWPPALAGKTVSFCLSYP